MHNFKTYESLLEHNVNEGKVKIRPKRRSKKEKKEEKITRKGRKDGREHKFYVFLLEYL